MQIAHIFVMYARKFLSQKNNREGDIGLKDGIRQ